MGETGGDADEPLRRRDASRNQAGAELPVADLPVDVPAPAVDEAGAGEPARMTGPGFDLDDRERQLGADRNGAPEMRSGPGLTVPELAGDVLAPAPDGAVRSQRARVGRSGGDGDEPARAVDLDRPGGSVGPVQPVSGRRGTGRPELDDPAQAYLPSRRNRTSGS